MTCKKNITEGVDLFYNTPLVEVELEIERNVYF